MNPILIEPHYLGSVSYFSLLTRHDKVLLEVEDTFQKQTYRNRAYFLLSNKVQPLIVPLNYRNGDKTKEVKVDYSQRWVKDHWGAFYSAYGKAPFFEYFQDEYRRVWDKRHDYLIDLSVDFIAMCFQLLQKKIEIQLTDRYEKEASNDFRNCIHPKKRDIQKNPYQVMPYPQLFGDTFTSDLSIVDLLLNEGSHANLILSKTTADPPNS